MTEADASGGERKPPTPFMMLVGSLGAQVQMALGLIEDPLQKKRIVELDAARQGIDLLAVLETKTKGNLDAEETKLLTALLTQLRLLYVEVQKHVAAAKASGGGEATAAGEPGSEASSEP